MTPTSATSVGPPVGDIKRVPHDAELREAIRSVAAEVVANKCLDRSRPLSREEIERRGRDILRQLELPQAFLGFAMVAVSNVFWRPVMEAIPFHRRLLLLPHCLSDRIVCTGTYDSIGLNCAGCGSCGIHDLKSEAERLGYSVIVAEGTSSVLMKVLDNDADAILGVACLDSLEKSFQRVVELGVPHMAVPLLKDGCLNTEVELGQIRHLLAAQSRSTAATPQSYVPLLRETGRMFQPPQFYELLGPYVEMGDVTEPDDADRNSVQNIALGWLEKGGKRLRPFVTLASYAMAKHGAAILDCGEDDLSDKVPLPVRRLAMAIEALHKASLVHDDIEDDDEYRYGRPTLHRVHGVGQAVNVGDFLIGLGYRLVAGEAAALGPDRVADILNRLSHAHLELCRGQGAELQSNQATNALRQPADVMKVAAQKTAPAFEVALYAGLRAAGAEVDSAMLRRFATYLGEGFQIRNDLDNWREDPHNKRKRGLDVRAGRVTMLHVFAAESRLAPRLAQLMEALSQSAVDASEELVERIYQVYVESGAFNRVEQLYRKLRDRATAVADEFPSVDLRQLTGFLARMILPEQSGLPVPPTQT